MAETRTRRSAKKSRGGCIRCKRQHLKCDERKPECGRCERLGIRCPGFSQTLKWSTKHELSNVPETHSRATQVATSTGSTAASLFACDDFDQLKFSDLSPPTVTSTEVPSGSLLEFGADSTWTTLDTLACPEQECADSQLISGETGHDLEQSTMLTLQAEQVCAVPEAITNEPYELISYYFKVMPRIYSTFDSHKNPFRTAVSKLFGHSLAVNLAAQSMAAAYLAEIHPRFESLGAQLRFQALRTVEASENSDYGVLLALMMSGPTGNWHETADLGIASYKSMKQRLQATPTSDLTDGISFFREGMVMWEMLLTFMADSNTLGPSLLLPSTQNAKHYDPHPWTGVGRKTMQVVADIGRLVRTNRLRSRNHKFVTQAHIIQMSQDLVTARELEHRLLACQHPQVQHILPTEDEATPVWHIRAMAELHRYAGLTQLYRVFPDLVVERMAAECAFDTEAMVEPTSLAVSNFDQRSCVEWLTRFSIEGLRMLEQVPAESGTRDLQPFVIVALASELVYDTYSTLDTVLQDTAVEAALTAVDTTFMEVALMRKFVIDRLNAILSLIPPKPVRACLDIVKETWRRIDAGRTDTYWLDVVIDNGWETIMA